jgi:hypothetical protein
MCVMGLDIWEQCGETLMRCTKVGKMPLEQIFMAVIESEKSAAARN